MNWKLYIDACMNFATGIIFMIISSIYSNIYGQNYISNIGNIFGVIFIITSIYLLYKVYNPPPINL